MNPRPLFYEEIRLLLGGGRAATEDEPIGRCPAFGLGASRGYARPGKAEGIPAQWTGAREARDQAGTTTLAHLARLPFFPAHPRAAAAARPRPGLVWVRAFSAKQIHGASHRIFPFSPPRFPGTGSRGCGAVGDSRRATTFLRGWLNGLSGTREFLIIFQSVQTPRENRGAGAWGKNRRRGSCESAGRRANSRCWQVPIRPLFFG